MSSDSDPYATTTSGLVGLQQPDETAEAHTLSQRFHAVSRNSSQCLKITDPEGNEVTLRPVAELPQQYGSVFNFPYFNIVQSKIFDTAVYCDDPVVLCAPTGSGKTVLFELAIIRLLASCEKNSISVNNVTAVYMAPIKALCSERYKDWKAKFEPFGVVCRELTGDSPNDDFHSLKNTTLIFTTPEKWDSMTRRWKDNKSFIKQIRLFMIDEIHLLNDGTRGATVEAVVSRMSVMLAQLHKNAQDMLRIIAVSATMANNTDIAEWLGPRNKPAATYKMGDRYRPVPLQRHVYGYFCNDRNDFKFDYSLNYKLPDIIMKHSKGRPTLIFVSTRKGTQQSAEMISKSVPFRLNEESMQCIAAAIQTLKDTALKECIRKGVGFHNAGLDFHERQTVEELFRNGYLLVLGEYTESELLQMIGRAGRPQYDTTATAVIMTKQQHQTKYERLVGGKQIIESSLHKNLVEHLNAEIVLGTIPQLSVALEWLKATFLYVRIMRNPLYYGLKGHQTRGSIEAYLQQLCVKQLDSLEEIGMITSDGGNDRHIVSTESGKLMARYCVSYGTMRKISSLTGQETQEQLVHFLASCQEFNDIQLRVSEKKVLNEMNKNKTGGQLRYPMKGKIQNTAMKVSCLIQVELGCLPMSEFSLVQDTAKVFRTASRITKCLVELYTNSGKADCLYNAVILNKCISSHLWENSAFITKQLPGIGIKNATCFINAGVHTFSKLLDLHPRDIELICSRHPPFGNGIAESIKCLPKYEMAIDQETENLENLRAGITVALRLANAEDLQNKIMEKHHCVLLLIYDKDNRITLATKIYDTTLLREKIWSRTISISRATQGDDLTVCLLSLSWVGLDICSVFVPKYSGSAFREFRKELQSQEKKLKTLNHSLHSAKEKGKVPMNSKQSQDSGACVVRIVACGHRCHNKQTCGHLCCKSKEFQQSVSGGTSSKKFKSEPSHSTTRRKVPESETEGVTNSQQPTISYKLGKFIRTRPSSYPTLNLPKQASLSSSQQSTQVGEKTYGNFCILGNTSIISDDHSSSASANSPKPCKQNTRHCLSKTPAELSRSESKRTDQKNDRSEAKKSSQGMNKYTTSVDGNFLGCGSQPSVKSDKLLTRHWNTSQAVDNTASSHAWLTDKTETSRSHGSAKVDYSLGFQWDETTSMDEVAAIPGKTNGTPDEDSSISYSPILSSQHPQLHQTRDSASSCHRTIMEPSTYPIPRAHRYSEDKNTHQTDFMGDDTDQKECNISSTRVWNSIPEKYGNISNSKNDYDNLDEQQKGCNKAIRFVKRNERIPTIKRTVSFDLKRKEHTSENYDSFPISRPVSTSEVGSAQMLQSTSSLQAIQVEYGSPEEGATFSRETLKKPNGPASNYMSGHPTTVSAVKTSNKTSYGNTGSSRVPSSVYYQSAINIAPPVPENIRSHLMPAPVISQKPVHRSDTLVQSRMRKPARSDVSTTKHPLLDDELKASEAKASTKQPPYRFRSDTPTSSANFQRNSSFASQPYQEDEIFQQQASSLEHRQVRNLPPPGLSCFSDTHEINNQTVHAQSIPSSDPRMPSFTKPHLNQSMGKLETLDEDSPGFTPLNHLKNISGRDDRGELLLIDKLGCTLSQAATETITRSFNSSTDESRNGTVESQKSFMDSLTSENAATRKANFGADIFDRSLINNGKPSIFGQTLKRNAFRGNPTATVKPLVVRPVENKRPKVAKGINVQKRAEAAPDEEASAFDSLDLLIRLKKRQKLSSVDSPEA